MENIVLVVRHEAYNSYHDHPELIKPIFALCQTTAGSEYVIRDVADERMSGSRCFLPGVKDIEPIVNYAHQAITLARTTASSSTTLTRYFQISSALISLNWVARSLAPLSSL